uniref:Uncharacterized protein n=1 Tax=Bracon brevicornis TaxID=1563983 RepID=A0A6V7J538_9HYME
MENQSTKSSSDPIWTMEVDEVPIVEEDDSAMECDSEMETSFEDVDISCDIAPANTCENIDIDNDSEDNQLTNATVVNNVEKVICTCDIKHEELLRKIFDNHAQINDSVKYHTCEINGLLMTYNQEYQWTNQAVNVIHSIIKYCPPRHTRRFKKIRKSVSRLCNKLQILHNHISTLSKMSTSDIILCEIGRKYDILRERIIQLIGIVTADEWNSQTNGLPELS